MSEGGEQPTVGRNDVCARELFPEEGYIGLWRAALWWECPVTAAVGGALPYEGVRVDVATVAGGEVAQA